MKKPVSWAIAAAAAAAAAVTAAGWYTFIVEPKNKARKGKNDISPLLGVVYGKEKDL